MLPQKEKRLISLGVLMVGCAVVFFSYKSLVAVDNNGGKAEKAAYERSVQDAVDQMNKGYIGQQRTEVVFKGTVPRTPNSEDTMHLSFIVFGKPGVSDAYTLIRSLTILTQGHLNFHIFSPDKSGEVVEQKVKTWNKQYQDQVTITKYATECPVWTKKSVNLPKAYRNTGAKICAYETMFNSNIRTVTEKVIYMDIDIIALDDFKNLWSQFHRFNSTQLMGSIRADIRYLHHGFEYTYGDYGLNGGVLLMDLTKMVNIGFIDEYFKAFDRKYKKNYNRDDQDMLNVYFSRHPDRMLNLSCSFNVRHSMDSCGTSPHRCYEAEQEGVKFLHACVEAVFTNSAYTPIYRCMQAIDFIDMPKSFECLGSGVRAFLEKRLPKCPTHKGFMNSFKTSLQNAVDVFNRRNNKNFMVNF